MAAGKYSFIYEQGTTTDFEIVWKDSAGSLVDLSGYEAKMQIKTDYLDNSGTTVLTLTSSAGDTYTKAADKAFISLSGSNLTTVPESGSIGIYIGYTAGTSITANEYFYDLELTHTNTAKRTRLIEGKVKVSKQVTD
jgi:hypothetical protein